MAHLGLASRIAVQFLMLLQVLAPAPLGAGVPNPGCTAVAGITADFPPYEFVDPSGEPRGFDVDLLRGVAQATGLNIQFQPGPWERIRSDLENRRIDLLAGMLRSREREQYADFSSPCLVVFYGIFVRKDTQDIQGLEDLRGHQVLVERGSQMQEYLVSLGFTREIVPVESEPAALRRLAEGEGEAALVPLLLGAMQMRDARITNVRRVGDSVYSRELCFAVAKGDRELLERLNTGLAILNQSGEYSRIYQKWFGSLEQGEATLGSLVRKAAWILIPLLALALAAIAWMWVLRRQVRQRTRELAQVNQRLQEKERFLQAIVDNLPVAVFGKDPNREFVYSVWNRRSEELFELPAAEVLGKSDFDLASREDAEFFRRTDVQAIQQRELVIVHEDHFWDSRHQRLQMHTVKVPIFDEQGRPWMLLAISEDVTDKKRTESTLRQSQANLAEAQRLAHLGSWAWDIEQDRAEWSEELYRILGLIPHSVPPTFRSALKRSHRADRSGLAACMRQAVRGHLCESISHRILLPGGLVRHLQTTIELKRDHLGKVVHLFGTTQDITERKNAEEALRQAQKLEGLGVLAGGIAHDFNNLLTAILANLNLAEVSIPPDSKAAGYLKNMEATVLKASDLTRQMLAYSGRGTFVIQSLDLNQVAREITQLLRASISKKVDIRFQLGEGLPCIEADIAQIQQVLMNLVTNAAEAIGDQEGAITFTTARLELDQAYLARRFPGQDLRPGPFVALEVSDTGCGMESEVKERLFEPFFTTKFSGRGLGLSALRGILKSHHAGIRIESEPGRGSTFQIIFPASGGTPPAGSERGEAAGAPATGTGTVLVVDDEPAVLASTSAMLERLGYRVLEARDGVEALELFRREGPAISVVLLDLTMPRLDGHETLRELQKLDPGVNVILCSGYHEQEALRETRLGELVGFLHKPFRLRDLQAALSKLAP